MTTCVCVTDLFEFKNIRSGYFRINRKWSITSFRAIGIKSVEAADRTVFSSYTPYFELVAKTFSVKLHPKFEMPSALRLIDNYVLATICEFCGRKSKKKIKVGCPKLSTMAVCEHMLPMYFVF